MAIHCRSAALGEDLIPEAPFAKELLVSPGPAAEIADREKVQLLELLLGIGPARWGHRPQPVVGKGFLGWVAVQEPGKGLGHLAGALFVNGLSTTAIGISVRTLGLNSL